MQYFIFLYKRGLMLAVSMGSFMKIPILVLKTPVEKGIQHPGLLTKQLRQLLKKCWNNLNGSNSPCTMLIGFILSISLINSQMSDFCENCNPHSSYHTTTGECLVDIRFAETYIFKDFYRLEKWEFIACSNKQFEYAVLGATVEYSPCSPVLL